MLERELAAWVAPVPNARALLFSTGYMANLGVVTALVGRDDAVFGDRLNHACLNDAALLSRAEFIRYAHANVGELAARLATSRARLKLICTDAVFSMDGDLAPLPRLLELADEHDAWLVVDDAHGFGVLGDGPTPGAARWRISGSPRNASSTWGRWARPPAWPAPSSPRIRGDRNAAADGAHLHLYDRVAAVARRCAARRAWT